ncbi:hypothetical protein [Pedobacter zeae]|uniref:DUF1320 domain-containing protein n=1 Tax=Pedobacter zeae TaxID=1737356 RepID=A0A7W6P4C1_9SPHI|nr:hypothetical protein [Pedobacter zeae]MBB4106628.1 hypothetical protein [Pedobacter zeae]GGH02810.1 hypothetical protein GCM10007422_17480 [Pedobacter zeae]
MPFITETDMYSHIKKAKVDLIKRDDPELMNEAIKSGISEAMSYMGKYDVQTMFAAEGSARDPLLLIYTKGLISFHFVTPENAGVDYEKVEDLYTKAIAFFNKVQANKSTPFGWPLRPADPLTGATPAKTFKYGSNPKRSNQY